MAINNEKTFIKYYALPIFLILINQVLYCQSTELMKSSIKTNPNKNLNMLASGYQLGGQTYIGFEYEYRFSRYIGANIGAGIAGYTAGLKFHSCPCRTGPFLNISFKDGGFGDFGTINAELGGVLFFFDKKEKIGVLGQVGIGKIIYLSGNYRNKYESKDLIMTFGLGISIYLFKKTL